MANQIEEKVLEPKECAKILRSGDTVDVVLEGRIHEGELKVKGGIFRLENVRWCLKKWKSSTSKDVDGYDVGNEYRVLAKDEPNEDVCTVGHLRLISDRKSDAPPLTDILIAMSPGLDYWMS